MNAPAGKWLEPIAQDSKRGRGGAGPKDALECVRVFEDRGTAETHAKDFPSSVYARRIQVREVRSNSATLTLYVLTVRRRFGL